MTSQQIGLLFIQLVISIGMLGFLGWCLLRSSETKQKYRLFAVRDKFLYLAATGVLPQNSMVFKVFYRAMNAYIAELDSVTIVSFVRASIAVKTQLEKEDRERLVDSLHRADSQVKETIDEFISIVMSALRHNSPMLTLILVFASHCAKQFSLLRKLRRFPTPVYETYRYYENMHGTMHTV